MKIKNYITVSMLLFIMLACVIPGFQTNSTPAPVVDQADILSTMVAETVSAAMAMTDQTFSTPTAAVLTENPDVSPPAPVSDTPTSISIQPPVFSSYGTSLQKLGDDSTLFIDQTAGYQFTVPPGWILIRPNEQEYFELYALPLGSNKVVQTVLNSMKNFDANVFRVYGFDFRDDHLRDDFVVNFDVTLNKDMTGSYEDVFSQIEKFYSNTELAGRFTVSSSGVTSTPSGVEAGVLILEINGTASTPDLKIYEKQVLLKIQSGGYLAIRFDTLSEFKDVTLAEFDQLIASLKSYTP